MKTLATGNLVAGIGSLFLLSLAGAFYFELYWILAFPFAFLFFLLGWKEPGWVFYLLIFSLPFSTEVFFENGFSTDMPGEGLMWLGSFVFLALILFRQRTNDVIDKNAQYSMLNVQFSGSTFKPGTKNLLVLVLVWMSWIFITASISPDPFVSFKYFLAKCWYIAAFVLPFIVWKDEGFVTRTIVMLLTAILIATGFVLWKHSGTGFSFATVNEAVRPFFRNHVNYSAMLVCTLPMIYFLAGESSAGLRRFLLMMGVGVLIALYFAYARGAWLALLAGGMAYLLIRARLMVIAFVSAILLVAGSIIWLKKEDRFLRFAPKFQTTVFHENFREHLVATYKLKDISTAERIHRWVAGVNMVAEHPIGGIGPNRFYEEYKPYTLPAFKTWVSDNPERSGVHNYFLLLAIEQGIPGLIIFLLLTGAMLYYSQRIFHRAMNPVSRRLGMMVGAMMTMILTLNFLSDLVETDKIGSLFFICLGILIRIR